MHSAKYLASLQIINSMVLFYGIHLSTSKVSDILKGSSIKASMRIIGVTLLINPIMSFIHYFADFNSLNAYFTTALSLTSLYMTSVGLTIGFLILLGIKISVKSPLLFTILLSVLIYPLFIWTGIAWGNEKYIDFVIITGHAIFFAVAILEATYTAHTYKLVKHKLDEYYADDLKIQISWISRHAYIFVTLLILSVVGVHFINYTPWTSLVIILYGTITYSHIYVGYHNMMISIMAAHKEQPKAEIKEILPVLMDEKQEVKLNLGSEVASHIEKQLAIWIDSKGYTKKNLTIQIVASEVYTNRTYLSSYINSVYNCSFKVWITKLRIEEAKTLLCPPNNLTMGQISDMVGFSSPTSFIHVFTKHENISPSRWRENCKNKQ